MAMNRIVMLVEDAAFSLLELTTIGLCLYVIYVFWAITP